MSIYPANPIPTGRISNRKENAILKEKFSDLNTDILAIYINNLTQPKSRGKVVEK
jgi:hypothetical protein